ncbi:plant invertase/pectin methylesterase inhibitor superfamily [Tasmannia lanceolata]|uniref:plant invertase/pectin methylesterase inhibitor superfamily n=1 Tax=Tasmannia lanceolata TaxID=3420 RepID=UPI0040633F34
MGYGRLGCSESTATGPEPPLPDQLPAQFQPSRSPKSKRKLLIFLTLVSIVLLSGSAISAVLLVRSRARGTVGSEPILTKPTQAISRTCSRTRYPSLCVDSLLQFPGALKAGERDLVHISVNMTLHHVGQALDGASAISNVAMMPRIKAAYDDCLELLDDSVDQLSQSLLSVTPGGGGGGGHVGSPEDVMTWLSAALTNQDTCAEGLADVSEGFVKEQMVKQLKDLAELVSNCLAIFAVANGNNDFAGIPIQNRRRLLESDDGGFPAGRGGFPAWVRRRERRLLQVNLGAIQADIVVSKDGNGTYKTIEQAIKAAPEKSSRRIIIYVKAGRYEENIKVGRKKTNLMFIGDGKGKTVISAGRSVFDNYTTFHTATFAATGAGFIARDITFENWAGPAKHQAVALRVGADHAVVYRCSVIGYQDTLYVHSQRQFFRECDVYGTVDFIFGNAAVVFQNCSLYARKPMLMQKNTITAQNRKDPNQNTGISIHNCRVVPTTDLEASKSSFSTYLGRPWKLYSRTVYMMSYMGDHINPAGWLEWNATFALDTLYYGEYMNYGPGGAVGQRVKWPGYRVITSPVEAGKFTVAQFIYGSSWLPSTGVAFVAGLSV